MKRMRIRTAVVASALLLGSVRSDGVRSDLLGSVTQAHIEPPPKPDFPGGVIVPTDAVGYLPGSGSVFASKRASLPARPPLVISNGVLQPQPPQPQPQPDPNTVPWPNFKPPQTLVPPSTPVITAPGATAYLDGGGGVTPTGEYEYAIPINVPAGRAGMQPNLAFHYSSRRRDHVAGVGWSISGLSVIHRCASSLFVDGRADGVDFDNERGTLCLDGKKLVSVGAEYRTERDEFLKITGSVGSGFTMYRKDGTIAEYKPQGLSWPIDSVRDQDKNEIRYKYSPNAPNLITEIQYTTRWGDQADGPYKIVFDYQPRGIPIRAYVAGQEAGQPHALKQIAISGPNGAAWTYTPTYVRSVVTRRLLLESVQMCAYGSCTQKRIFEYDAAAPAWQLSGELEEGPSVGATKVQVLDLDGNGKDDVMYPHGAVMRVMRMVDSPQVTGFISTNAFVDEYPAVVDIDGDKRDEVVAYDDSSHRWRLYRYSTGVAEFAQDVNFLPQDVTLSSWAGYDEMKVKRRERPYFVDLNGDGLPEMVKHVLKDTGGLQAVAVTRVWSNVNGSFVQALDIDNKYFPVDDTLLANPPEELVNYPPRLDVRVEDRYGDRRQALVQRAYPIGQNYSNPYQSHYDKLIRRDDNGSLIVEDDDAPSDTPRAELDLDGDGLREWLYFDGDSDNPAENVLASTETNRGAGQFLPGPKVAIDGGYAKADEMDWLVGDLDEDGKEDLVMAPRATTVVNPYVELVFPTEDATNGGEQRLRVQALPLVMPGYGTYRTRAVRFGDFDADGRADLLVVLARCSETGGATVACDAGLNETYFQIYTRQGSSPDQLVRVRDDGAARVREELTWMQWRKPNKGGMTDACTYPAECIKRGFPVVREHRFLNPALPAPKLDRVSYMYDAPRGQIAGRGFLGFGIVRAWYPERPMEVTTTYLTQYPEGHVYPYASSPGLETTVIPILNVPPSGRYVPGEATTATARVIQKASWYDWKYTAGTANTTRFRYSETREWEEDVSIDWSDVYGDHIFNVGPPPAAGTPEAGSRRRKRWVDWDDLGNVTLQTAETVGGVKSQVENVYQYPTGKWPVALLKTQYVRSARTQSSAWKTRQTNFHYYGSFKLRTVVQEPSGTTQQQQTTLFERDPVTGLVTYMRRYASGEPYRWTFYQYDSTGAHVVFEGNNLKHATWRKVWPELGVTTVAMDANGASINYLHDGFGRVQKSMPEGGATTDYDYILQGSWGAYGGLIDQWKSDDTGASGYGATDDIGRPIERCSTAFWNVYSCAYTQYDALGQARKVTSPGASGTGGVPTTTTFDSLGRVQDRAVGGLGAAKFFHGFSHTIAFEPNGSPHYILRDKDDRVIQSTDYPDATTGVSTTYTYAEFDNVERVDVDGQNMSVSTYDTLGRLTGRTDADMGAMGYGYNAFGEVTVHAFADFTARYFKYDAAGRVYEVNDTGSSAATNTIEWDKALNGIGSVSKTTSTTSDGTIVTKPDYDSLGRPWRKTWTVDSTQSFSISTFRDDYGRINQVQYPSVAGWPTLRVDTTYGEYGHPAVVTAKFLSPDSTQKLWEVKKRELDGSLTRGILGNLVETNRTYDGAGRLATQKWTGSLVTMDMEYDYDDSGNVTSRIDHSTARSEVFEYDGLSRLRHWWLSVGSKVQNLHTEYTYDDLGNLKKVYRAQVLKDNNTYGAQGKPHALANDGFGATFTYDSRGRLFTAADRKFTYTQFDLPKKIETSAATWDFRYDAGQDRVIKTDGANTTLRIADVYERKTTSSGTKHTFRVPGTDGLAAEITYDSTISSQPVIRYLSGDRNGSVTLVTGAMGALVERHYFDPFGKRISSSNTDIVPAFQSPIGFGEHPHDDELGLIDMTGRVYDPRRRRFLTPDPIVPNPLAGQAYNRYSFGFQNPVTFNDPGGHDPTADMPGLGMVPFGFIIQLAFSSASPVSSSGSGGSVLPPGARVGKMTVGPPPPPKEVRTNLEQYSAGFGRNEDPAPGCQQSKGGTAMRPCAGPGDQGCTQISPTEDYFDIGQYGSKAYTRANKRYEVETYEHRISPHERMVRGVMKAMSVCNEDYCPDPRSAEAAGVFLTLLPMMVGEAPPGALTAGVGISEPLGARLSYVYALFNKGTGLLEKWGSTSVGAARYPRSYIAEHNLEVRAVAWGTRADMWKIERELTGRFPGRLNLEPWAGKAPGRPLTPTAQQALDEAGAGGITMPWPGSYDDLAGWNWFRR